MVKWDSIQGPSRNVDTKDLRGKVTNGWMDDVLMLFMIAVFWHSSTTWIVELINDLGRLVLMGAVNFGKKKQTDPVALHGEETGTLIPDWRGPTADQRRK
jgi:hypothetical protein